MGGRELFYSMFTVTFLKIYKFMTKSHSFTERFKRQHDKHVNRDFHSSVQISYDVVK